MSNLNRSEAALAALASNGLDADTIAAVGAGLREPHRRADGKIMTGVITYPTTSKGGRTRYGCLNLPGVTEHPNHEVGWSTGVAEAISYGEGQVVVVCCSALEAWLAWQTAERRGVAITAVASSRPDHPPSAWLGRRVWSGWKRLLVTEATSRALTAAISAACGRPLERCLPVPKPSPDRAVQAEDLEDWLMAAMDGGAKLPVVHPTAGALPLGDHAKTRTSIHGGYHEGRMYYGFAVERRERSDAGFGLVFSYRTLVLRSDGIILEPGLLPAPRGTPLDQRVHALSDGTRIMANVAVADGVGWSLPAIKRFASRSQAREIYDGPSAASLRADLLRHVKASVWLPDDEAYDQVAAYVMATYFYRLFDAFPLLYLNGPKASGKSELASALVAVSFNATMMAQGSGAALVRLARDCGGLVALDDAEALGGGFGELAQILKVGYKASTAVKRLVAPSGAVETIDFFGPRIISNTRGLDDILLSRCIAIRMAPRPSGVRIQRSCLFNSCEWRDWMHDFAMSHVDVMGGILDGLRGGVRDRAGELALPMRAIGRLTEA